MEIREAIPEEFEEIANLTLEAHHEYGEVLAPEEWKKMRTGIAKVKGRHGECEVIVAEAKGDLVGLVALHRSGHVAGRAFPERVGFHPAARVHSGQGIGTLLTEERIRRAYRDGAERIGLHTGEPMRTARNLYERMGFQKYKDLSPMFGVSYLVYSMKLTD